jgi:predicted dehydrogenase
MATTQAVLDSLNQQWARPTAPRPIVVIGAGSIVRDAHLPTYARLRFPVAGIFDINHSAAAERVAQFKLPRAFDSLTAALATDAIFDLAVPPHQIAAILDQMRPNSAVLIQKPMGRDLADARRILARCRERQLTAAMNFQLRFAPNMLALRDAIERGLLGEFTDLEVRITLHTPWNYWAFLKGEPRLEVLMHSIHYLDLVRSMLGEPRGVYCKGVRHPELPDYADSRTSIILDYEDRIRASLTMNHAHRFNPRHAVSQLKLEGTRGAAIAKMGVNLNYPEGEPDRLEVTTGGRWHEVPLRGSWFLEAFEGPTANLQRFLAGEDQTLMSPIEDAFKTMALVEACYESSARGGTPIQGE